MWGIINGILYGTGVAVWVIAALAACAYVAAHLLIVVLSFRFAQRVREKNVAWKAEGRRERVRLFLNFWWWAFKQRPVSIGVKVSYGAAGTRDAYEDVYWPGYDTDEERNAAED